MLLMNSGMEHVDIYGKWMQGMLIHGQDKDEILSGWTKQSLPGTGEAVRRRLMRIARQTRPSKEWHWIRHRLLFR
ncbi:MAG: hypothetical protein V5B78_11650 [Desulfohalobiaceae bacterium]